MVDFEVFEGLLSAKREASKLTYSWFVKHGMTAKTVLSIEHGGNYRMSSLFKFAGLMNCKIMVNSREIDSYHDLGPLLMFWRKKLQYNRVEMSKATGLTMGTLNTMERGGDFTRETLAKYGSKVDIMFSLLTPVGEPDPFDSGRYMLLEDYLAGNYGEE